MLVLLFTLLTHENKRVISYLTKHSFMVEVTSDWEITLVTFPVFASIIGTLLV